MGSIRCSKSCKKTAAEHSMEPSPLATPEPSTFLVFFTSGANRAPDPRFPPFIPPGGKGKGLCPSPLPNCQGKTPFLKSYQVSSVTGTIFSSVIVTLPSETFSSDFVHPKPATRLTILSISILNKSGFMNPPLNFFGLCPNKKGSNETFYLYQALQDFRKYHKARMLGAAQKLRSGHGRPDRQRSPIV